MSQIIIMDGQPFAILIEGGPEGSYLMPPIVLDHDGNIIDGHEILAAMSQAGVTLDSAGDGIWTGRTALGTTVQHPYLTGKAPADLAEIDQAMASISRQLGVPIGPPGS